MRSHLLRLFKAAGSLLQITCQQMFIFPAEVIRCSDLTHTVGVHSLIALRWLKTVSGHHWEPVELVIGLYIRSSSSAFWMINTDYWSLLVWRVTSSYTGAVCWLLAEVSVVCLMHPFGPDASAFIHASFLMSVWCVWALTAWPPLISEASVNMNKTKCRNMFVLLVIHKKIFCEPLNKVIKKVVIHLLTSLEIHMPLHEVWNGYKRCESPFIW